MLSKLGIPLAVLGGIMMLFTPSPASAKLRFTIGVGNGIPWSFPYRDAYWVGYAPYDTRMVLIQYYPYDYASPYVSWGLYGIGYGWPHNPPVRKEDKVVQNYGKWGYGSPNVHIKGPGTTSPGGKAPLKSGGVSPASSFSLSGVRFR
jgi:hypothetical protein